jgi:hypothetical protein
MQEDAVFKRLVLIILMFSMVALTSGCDRPTQVLPGDNQAPLLTWEQQGGIAGFQDRLVLGHGGEYYLSRGGGLERIGSLPPESRTQLDVWRGHFAPFTLKLQDNPGGPDNLIRQLRWAGLGTVQADELQQQEILDWAFAVFAELSSGEG